MISDDVRDMWLQNDFEPERTIKIRRYFLDKTDEICWNFVEMHVGKSTWDYGRISKCYHFWMPKSSQEMVATTENTNDTLILLLKNGFDGKVLVEG
jgi:hypothetical protein